MKHATTSVLDEIRGMQPVDNCNLRSYFDLVEVQAEKLLELLGVSEGPIDINVMERVPGVVVRHHTTNLPAMHERITLNDNGTFTVVIDGSQDVETQRLQLAHALRHVLTYTEGANIDWTCWDQAGRDVDELDEALADRFALALLMPDSWVRNAYGDGITALHDLAAMFGVSLNRMAYRLGVLGLPINEEYGRTATAGMQR